MKKIIAGVLISLGLVASTFARPAFFLDFGPGVAFTKMTDKSGSKDVVTDETQFSLDVDFRVMFTEVIGIYANLDVYFPTGAKVSVGDASTDISRSDYDSWLGARMLIGPSIMPVHTDTLGFTIAPGFICSVEQTQSKIGSKTSTSELTFTGLGCDLALDFYLSKKMYFKVGMDTSLYTSAEQKVTYDGNSNSKSLSDTTAVEIEPKVAIGFRF